MFGVSYHVAFSVIRWFLSRILKAIHSRMMCQANSCCMWSIGAEKLANFPREIVAVWSKSLPRTLIYCFDHSICHTYTLTLRAREIFKLNERGYFPIRLVNCINLPSLADRNMVKFRLMKSFCTSFLGYQILILLRLTLSPGTDSEGFHLDIFAKESPREWFCASLLGNQHLNWFWWLKA